MGTPTEFRYCIGCTHFILELGEEDWSEVTPGELAWVACAKRHFDYLGRKTRCLDMEKVMLTARTCADYQERSPV
jgi:hypothetical protein